jgi:acyl-CoA synthetase (AMP-forming)/AMP-acid ligase II
VSLHAGADASAEGVIATCKAQLAGYKAPKRVVFVDRVPRAPNAKADYPAAKELALQAVSAEA